MSADALDVWMDGKPIILIGFEQSGKLDMWMDGRPVVRIGAGIIPTKSFNAPYNAGFNRRFN